VGGREDGTTGTPRIWHAALVLAFGALAGATLLAPESAGDPRAVAQLRIARVGLVVLAGGLAGLWLLRGVLSGDLRGLSARMRAAPDPIPVASLVPRIEPRILRLAAWTAGVAWIAAASIGLARGAGWVEDATWENGPTETVTVLAYLGASALCLHALGPALAGGFRSGTPRRWFLLAAAAGCFLIAAEETDWGQTYFKYRTPETFEHANIQQDLSLHNLALPEAFGVTRWANWVLGLGALALGGLVPAALFASGAFRRFVWALDVPLPPVWSMAMLLAAFTIPEVDGQFRRNNIGSELREVTIAVAVLAWLVTAWRATRRGGTGIVAEHKR